MERLKRDFSRFLYENRWTLCLTGLLLILALYHFLLSDNIRMDSVIKLATPGDEFNDLQLGRFGIVYLNRLTGMRWFSPYVMGFQTMLALLAVSLMLCFMAWRAVRGQCGWFACGLPLVVFLTPNWIEQLYYSYQAFLVVLSVLFLEIAVLLPEYFPSKRWIVPEVLLVFVAFSVYQAFVPLYIALCIGYVLLCFLGGQMDDALRVWRRLLRHACVFALALAACLGVNRLLQRNVTASDYLSSQVLWGIVPLPGVVTSILRSVATVVLCQGRLETPMYTISAGLSLLLLLIRWIRLRDSGHSLTALIGWLLLQVSAFAMTLVIGRRSYLRADLALTFVIAFNLCAAAVLACQCTAGIPAGWLRRAPLWIVIATTVIGLYGVGNMCFRLIYTDDVRNAADNVIALKVVDRVRETDLLKGDKTLIFVGEPSISLNEGCLKGETIGRSLFNRVLDCASTNHLIANIMEINGINYRPLTEEDIAEAQRMALDMPCFPDSGSVAESDRVVVVKFSEDYYYPSETIRPGATRSDETVEYDQTSICHVDSVAPGNGVLMIRGSNICRGVPSREVENCVYLLNHQSGDLYRVNTACEKSVQITNQYWRDQVDYDQGGFIAVCPLSVLQKHAGGAFEVLVKYTRDGESRFVATGAYLDRRRGDKGERTGNDGPK